MILKCRSVNVIYDSMKAKKFFRTTNKATVIKEDVRNTLELYKNYISHFFRAEDQIASLYDFSAEPNESIVSLIDTPTPLEKVNMFTTYSTSKVTKKTLYIALAAVLPVVAFFTVINPVFSMTKPQNPKYAIFSSKPLTLGGITQEVASGDPRAAKLDGVFARYDCPNFVGLGSAFVQEADKNNIPFWLVPAVSFQESDCGNTTPKKHDIESYNAYGWGVWGKHVKTFDNWEHGIAVVSKYMNETFYSQGITDACEIMKTYTPPSNGSWCKGVEHFRDVINNYQTTD